MNDLQIGSIIVARSHIQDSDFGRSVILVLRRDSSGVLGVNVAVKPNEGSLVHKSGPEPLPVRIRLHKYDVAALTSEKIADTGYAFRAVHCDTDANDAEAGGMVLEGYAKWKEDRLDREVADGKWLVTTTTLEEILTAPPEERWKVAAAGADITARD